MRILTHRGLEPENPGFHFAESSYEAFESQLRRGYWIEFDVNFSKDWTCFAFHDSSMRRMSGWKDVREFAQMDYAEIQAIPLPWNCRFATLSEIIGLISDYSGNQRSALHLKANHTSLEKLEILANALNKNPDSKDAVFVFDVKTDVARFLRERIPWIQIFASVAHAHDVSRYSSATWSTLLTPQEFETNSSLYDGVWLDEWDLSDENDGTKKLYTQETFSRIRKIGKFIGLVTPELHAKSPWLLGGEAHPDGNDSTLLKLRITEIIGLQPDYVCTDYPEYFEKIECSRT